MYIPFSYFGFLLLLKRYHSEREFVRAFKVRKGAYGDELARRIYRHLYRNARDARREYEAYYKKEYRDLLSFLYWRYDVPESALHILSQEGKRFNFVGICPEMYDGEYNLSQFLASEQGEELLKSVFCRLEKRGVS